MNTSELSDLFKNTTSLKPPQIKTLVSAILEYDESNELAYECVGMLNGGHTFDKVMDDFKKRRFDWESSVFVEQHHTRQYRDNSLTKPPEIREGEIECPKCKSRKTYVIEMQTRSADEGFSYWIQCLNPKCKHLSR